MKLLLGLVSSCVLAAVPCNGQESRLSMMVGREFEISGFDKAGPVTVTLVEYYPENVGNTTKWVLAQAGEAGVEVGQEAALKVFEGGLGFIKGFNLDLKAVAPSDQRNSMKLYRDKGFLRVSAQAGKSQTVMVAFYAAEAQSKLAEFEKFLSELRDVLGDSRLQRISAIIEEARED